MTQKEEQLRKRREKAEALAKEREKEYRQQRFRNIIAILSANSKIRGSVAAKG